MRPIDADALYQEMVKTIVAMMRTKRWMRADKDNEDEILLVIQNAPTIDYEPVRHGEWIPLEETQWNCFGLVTIGYRCSECGREEPHNNEPYCHCGAKMDAKEE